MTRPEPRRPDLAAGPTAVRDDIGAEVDAEERRRQPEPMPRTPAWAVPKDVLAERDLLRTEGDLAEPRVGDEGGLPRDRNGVLERRRDLDGGRIFPVRQFGFGRHGHIIPISGGRAPASSTASKTAEP